MTSSISRQNAMLMIGSSVLFLLIGLGLVASATIFTSTTARLRTEGQTIVADVVDSRVIQSTRRGRVTSKQYEVKYRFQPPGQSVVMSDWVEAPEDVVRGATQAKAIEVRYLPSDPSVNLPSASVGTEAGPSVTSIWHVMVGAAFVVLGLAILSVSLRRPRAPEPFSTRPVMFGPVR